MARHPEQHELERSGLGAGVWVAAGEIGQREDELFPAEAALVSRAVDKRRREFAAGRSLARQLLRELGIPDAPLLSRTDRTPLWPDGVVGSITHTDDSCAVAIARSADVRSLGIDLEPRADLPADLLRLVCTEGELRWLSTQESERRGVLARLLFSAKEAAYKCQFPLTGMLLGFTDVEVELDEPRRAFRATWLPAELSERGLGSQRGTFLLGTTWILTGVVLRA